MSDFTADLLEISRAFNANMQNGGLEAVRNMVSDLGAELAASGEIAAPLEFIKNGFKVFYECTSNLIHVCC